MLKSPLKLVAKTLGFLLIPAVFLYIGNGALAAVGLSVGHGALNLGQTENLYYGNIGLSSHASSSFLLFQKNAGDIFKIDNFGNLTTSGAITAGAFSGPITGGSINAANVSAGSFGANLGGGNYSFPGRLGVGLSNPSYKLDVNGVARFGTSESKSGIGSYTDDFIGIFPVISSNNHGDFSFGSNLSLRADHSLNTINNHAAITGAAIILGGNGHSNGVNSINFYANTPGAAVSGATTTAGQVAMIIKGGGNVGIGATNPLSKLVVAGTTDLAFTDTSNLIRFSRVSNVGQIQNYAGGSASTLSLNPGGGNVGIGTTNPWAKLASYGTVQGGVFDALEVKNEAISAAGNGVRIVLSPQSNYYPADKGAYIEADFDNVTSRVKLKLGARTAGDIMTLDGNGGNVGIGTTTPVSTLDVNGLIKMRTTNITQPEDVINKAYLTSALNGGEGFSGVAGFWKLNGSALFASSTDWNVGVGTTAPGSEKLAVTGGRLSTIGDNDIYSGGELFSAGTGPNAIAGRLAVGQIAAATPSFFVNGGAAIGSGYSGSNIAAGNLAVQGNVGIGTTTPTAKLYAVAVNGTDNTGYNFIFDNQDINAAHSNGLLVKGGANANSANIFAAQDYSGNTDFVIRGDGNVGIGIVNPTYKVHASTSGYTNGIAIENTGSGTAAEAAAFRMINNLGGEGAYLSLFSSSNTMNADLNNQLYVKNTVGGMKWIANTGSSIGFGVGSGISDANDLFISSAGNVGIGTTSPSANLEVAGIGAKIRLTDTTVAGGTFWDFVASSGSSGFSLMQGGTQVMRIRSNGNVGFGLDATPDFRFGVEKNGLVDYFGITNVGSGDVMVIKNSGNVGISTATPVSTLDVNGLIKMRTTNITQPEDVINKAYLTSALNGGEGFSGVAGFWKLNGSALFASSTDWNVGVGTSAPGSEKLAVTGGRLSTIGDNDIYSGGELFSAGTGPNAIAGRLAVGQIAAATPSFFVNGGAAIGSGYSGSNIAAGNLAVQGNVGIGTTTPLSKLNVVGDIRVNNGKIYLRDNTGYGDTSHYVDYDSAIDGIVVSGYRGVSLGAQGSNILNVRDSGNVGIGTTSPAAKLDIIGSGLKISASDAGRANNYTMSLVSNHAEDTGYLAFAGGGGAGKAIGATGYGADTVLYSNNTERIRILNNGNVGIGTTNPGAKLDVVRSTAGSVYTLSTNPTLNIIGNAISARTDAASQEILRLHQPNSSGGSKGSTFGIGLSFWQDPGNNYPRTRADFMTTGRNNDDSDLAQTVMSLRDDGNVGIGTTTPVSTLDVNGLIKMRTTNITQPEDVINKAYLTSALNGGEGFSGVAGFWKLNGSALFASSTDWNVGVGTSAPGSEKLAVTGGRLSTIGDNDIYSGGELFSAGTGPNAIAGRLAVGQIGAATPSFFVNGGAAIGSGYSGSNIATGNLAVQGNVGIGITNPSTSLHVSGDITLTGFQNRVNEYESSWLTVNSFDGITDTAYLNFGNLRDFGHVHIEVEITGWANSTLAYGSLIKHYEVRPRNNAGTWTLEGVQSRVAQDSGYVSATVQLGEIEVNGNSYRIPIKKVAGAEQYRIKFRATSWNPAVIGDFSPSITQPTAVSSGTREYTKISNRLGVGMSQGSQPQTPLHVVGNSYFDGNVGIGVSGPSQKLDVQGRLVVGNMTSSRGSYGNTLNLTNNNGYDTSLFLWQSGVASGHFGFAASSTLLRIVNSTSDGSITNPASINLTSSGLVGIGTATPVSTLDVNGLIKMRTTNITQPEDVINKAYLTSALNGGEGFSGISGFWKLSGSSLFASSTTWNVGIGTAAPGSEKLAVTGGRLSTIGDNDIYSGGELFSAGTGPNAIAGRLAVGQIGAATPSFFVNGGAAIGSGYSGSNVAAGNLAVQGNVGIGTTNPSSKLELGNLGTTGSDGIVLSRNSGYGSGSIKIDYGTADTITVSSHSMVLNSGSAKISMQNRWYADGAMSRIKFSTMRPNNNNISEDRMIINEYGNIGIGTTDPQTKLHLDNTSISGISETLRLSFANEVGGGSQIGFFAGSNVTKVGQIENVIDAAGGDSSLRFYTYKTGVGLGERMRINNNGYVGIGTINPSYKLDVRGGAYIEGLMAVMAGESFSDKGMLGILYDRNELTNAALRGTSTISITNGGTFVDTAENKNKLVDSSGQVMTIDNLTASSIVQIKFELSSPVNHYGRAYWQPFFQTRTLTSDTSATFPRSIVVEVSNDGSIWYKPANGVWTNNDFITNNFSGLWMATEGSPNSPAALPGWQWKYARFTLSNFVVGTSYGLWISELGMRHVSAPAARQFVSATGDSIYGNLDVSGIIKMRTTNITQPEDVINKAYLTSALNGGEGFSGVAGFWKLSGSALFASSTTWNVGVGTSAPGSEKLAVTGGRLSTIGDNDIYSGGELFSAGTGPNAIAGRLAVGQIAAATPSFFVNGGAAIGSGYSGSNIATGNLAVQGKIGVGNTNPVNDIDIVSSNNAHLKLSGGNSGYTNADIILQANSDSDYRGLGTFLYQATSQKEWYIGSPYTDADSIIIARQTSLTSHNANTAQNSNALLKITSAGNVGIGLTNPGTYKLNVSGPSLISGASSFGADIMALPGASFQIDSIGGTSYVPYLTDSYSDQFVFKPLVSLEYDTTGGGNWTSQTTSIAEGLLDNSQTTVLNIPATTAKGLRFVVNADSWLTPQLFVVEQAWANGTPAGAAPIDVTLESSSDGSNWTLRKSPVSFPYNSSSSNRYFWFVGHVGDIYWRVTIVRTDSGTQDLSIWNVRMLSASNMSRGYQRSLPFQFNYDKSFNFNGGTMDIKMIGGQTENAFRIKNSANNPLLVVNGSGNVGIGIATASSTLDVNGLIKMRTTNITQPEDVINKAYLTSALNGGEGFSGITGFWKLSGSALFASSTSWNVGVGTNSPGTEKLAVTGGRLSTIGDNDIYSGGELFSAGTGPNAIAGRLAVGQIGAATPSFFVNGGAAIGSGYSGSNVAAGNLAVQGNVGIGTTNPDQMLTIETSGVGGVTGNLRFRKTTSTAGMGSYIQFDSSASASARGNYNARIEGLRSPINDGSSMLSFFTTNVSQSSAAQERLRITDTGYVGVGTTNPLNILNINGGYGAPSTTATPNGQLILSDDGTGLINTLGIDNPGNPYAWIQPRHKTSAAFYNLSLNPLGGNVGIGTTSPKAKLHVAGGVVMNHTTVADSDYTLQDTDYVVGYSSMSGDHKVNVPNALCTPGRFFVIVDESGEASPAKRIIIDPEDPTLIVGASTFRLSGAFNSVYIFCGGNNAWYVL